jgi:hypothetical protein
MAFSDDVKQQISVLINQVKFGSIASTDASRIAAEFVFQDAAFTPSEAKNIWREYDESLAAETAKMLEKLLLTK